MSTKIRKVRTPLFPLYSQVRTLMVILQDVKKSTVTKLIQSIWAQTGTPKDPVDWTDPDSWIGQRLTDVDAHLAHRIWNESKKTINPRHIYGAYLFINGHGLLIEGNDGIYALAEKGQRFLDNDFDIVRELDDLEGLLELLSILSTKARVKRAELLPEWSAFLLEYSNYSTQGTFNDTLRRRLGNLVERKLVSREGNAYEITEDGQKYLEKVIPSTIDPTRDVLKSINEFNLTQREALRERLAGIDPYQFEHLVGELMDAMGYEDVTVTKATGDKGVDVVATIQFGITTVREVVQVKRHGKGTLIRDVVDKLRGSLPYHQAIRGTIITLGKVSKGAKEAAIFPGAAPITLIDGERLLDLLIEHEIGIKKKPVSLWELEEVEVTEEQAG